jgi:rRNA maturation endonuclease Nob1
MMLGMAISGAGFSLMTPSLGATDLMVKNLAVQFAGTLSRHDIDAFAALFTDDFNHQRTATVPPPPAGT